MSDMKASVAETKAGFHVEGYEKIEYDFTFQDQVFNPQHPQLASEFMRWKRCLAVMDLNIYNIYGEEMESYFKHFGIELKIHKTMIGEKAKSMDTLLSIVDSMTEFGRPLRMKHPRMILLTAP
jgi:3-dehydroquinate synthase